MGVKIREGVSKKGRYWDVRAYYRGREQFQRFYTKREAVKLKKELEDKMKDDTWNLSESQAKNNAPTFREYAEKWMKGHVALNLKESSYAGYAGLLKNHIYPIIGDKKINEITRTDVKELCYEKQRFLSKRSVKYIAVTISTIFSHAKEDGIVDLNPAEKSGKFIKLDSRTEKIGFLLPEEVTQFLEAARDYFPKMYPLFLTALRTGMRQGELLGLKWDDVDFNGQFIEVRRSWYSRGMKFTSPKNKRVRRVDMSDQLTATLKEWRKVQVQEMFKRGIKSDLVFSSDNGTPLDASNVRRGFEICLKKAGLRKIRFHDLRHTYASLLINLGESLAYIKDQLGHHSIQITVDTYGHLIPSSNRGAVNKLDELDRNIPEWTKKEE